MVRETEAEELTNHMLSDIATALDQLVLVAQDIAQSLETISDRIKAQEARETEELLRGLDDALQD